MTIKLAVDIKIIKALSCYAPPVVLENIIKDTSYDQLQGTVRKVGAYETLMKCGDLNGHIGKLANGYEGVHGGYGYGLIYNDGENILKFSVANNLVAGNSYFNWEDNHLITYQSGGISSQLDYIFIRKSNFRLVRDIKGEEVVTEHRMLVSDIEWKFTKQKIIYS